MRFQKWRSLVFAVLLLLICSPLALAQPNPPFTDDQTAGMAGTALAVYLGCLCVALLVGIAIKVAVMVFIYKDAKARGTDPMLWLVLAFFFDIIVLIVWLIVRPPPRV